MILLLRLEPSKSAGHSGSQKDCGTDLRAVDGLGLVQPESLHLRVAADVATEDFPRVDADAELQ